MRVADRPLPPVKVHTDEVLNRWPVRPVIAISGNRIAAEWDDPNNEWDSDVDPAASARVGTARVGRARVGQG